MSFLGLQKLPVIGKEQELLDASRTGNVATVEKLLTSKHDKSKRSTVVKLTSFLKSVNVNCTDKNGYTPLHHASVNGHRDIVEVLLRCEAQPGVQDNQGCTPVHLAAWNGNPEIVMQLLNAGSEAQYGSATPVEPVHINQQNEKGDTALHCAAQYGHVAVIDVLLQKSANPTIRNLTDAAPLDLAAQYGRLEVVQRLLISHPELVHRSSTTQSPLHLASRNGHRDIVAVLLDNNFGLHTKTDAGTALHEAALHGKLDIVRLLLEHGIDVHQKDNKGQTALELITAHQSHQSQQRSFTDIMTAIQESMHQSGGQTLDSGLYESLSSCHSGSGKPTAAVKPLPPETTHQSEQSSTSPALKPRLPDKSITDQSSPPSETEQTTSSKPLPQEQANQSGRPVPPLKPHPSATPPSKLKIGTNRQSLSPNIGSTGEKPVPSPRRSLIQLTPDKSPDESPAPVYTEVKKDKPAELRVVSHASAVGGVEPPPLPPRTSVFAAEHRTPALAAGDKEPDTKHIPEKTKSMSIPKKPPRHKKSPAPARRADNIPEVNAPLSPTTPPTSPLHSQNAPELPSTNNASVTSCDSAISDHSTSQHSSKQTDQSGDCIDGCEANENACSKPAEPLTQDVNQEHSATPGKSPKPVLPPRNLPAKMHTDDVTSDTRTDKHVTQSVYVEMKPTKPRPVSEVKPQVSAKHIDLAPPTQNKVDNYGILFPNLRKDSIEKTKKSDLQRSMSSPEDEPYVGHHPVTPTAKFLEKQGLLRRTNTAPEEPSYMPMTGPTPCDNGTGTQSKENEYSEIPEKSPGPSSPNSPKENIYATIPESKEVDTGDGVYSSLKDMRSGSTKDPTKRISTGSEKPRDLELRQRSPCVGTPLTPTGYAQPPTPDFPPPSPTTALLGIELKIQQIDSKRKSKDIETLTDSSLETNQGSEVKVTTSTTYTVKVTGQRSPNEGQGHTVDSQGDNLKQTSSSGNGNIDQSQADDNKNTTPGNSAVLDRDKSNTVNIQTEGSVIDKDNQAVADSNIPSSETSEGAVEDSGEMLQSIRNRLGSSKDKAKKDLVKNESKDGDTTEQKRWEGAGASPAGASPAGTSPVVMRRKSSSSANPDMDVFKGLLRGSTIGIPRKATSQFYSDVLRKTQTCGKRDVQSTCMTGKTAPPVGMEREEEIDVDQVMKSIDVEVARRTSGAHESSAFDDTEEWQKIQDIMASFGSSIARESVFVKDYEPKFVQMLAGQGQMVSVGEWLESINMAQYENNFIANGFDNIDYLDPRVLDEQDLEQIGVLAHDHRQKILQATKALPQLKPIDVSQPPSSLEEWLASLQLLEYLETFRSHGYDTMDKVQSILWELQLRTVLDISQLGHRKRILASLGERKPLERQNSQTKRPQGPPSPEKKSPLDINLFKDYTNVKPVSSSEEDIKDTTGATMAVDSSEDEDVFRKNNKTGQSIRNSNIHIRPPHLAQTSSPARQWRHKPEMLIKGCCNYTAQYLGSTVVGELTGGTECTKGGITKLKLRFFRQLQKTADVLAKIPIIMLSISYKGVKFIDAKSKKVICEHEIGNIFCACQDSDHLNFFAYITRDIETGQHYCHVFSVKSSSLAHDIILTLGESFEVAFQMAMKERSLEEAMELDRKTSQSDMDDTQSVASKHSTNTV